MESLTNAQIRGLKARAQRMNATLKIGKEGLSPQFLSALDQRAEMSGSHLVTRLWNVVVPRKQE